MKTRTFFLIIILIIAGFGVYTWLNTRSDNQPVTDSVDFELNTESTRSQSTDTTQAVIPEDTESSEETETIQDESTDEIPSIVPGGTEGSITPPPGYVSSSDALNILVNEPKSDAVLSSPFVVSGEARVFENVVTVRVTKRDGTVLIEEQANAHPTQIGEFGPFDITLNYQFSTTKEGYVEVFSENARDGSKSNMVKIPVSFE